VKTDESFSQSFMLLCFTAAGVLLLAWQPSSQMFSKPKIPTLLNGSPTQQVSNLTNNNTQLVVDLSDRRSYVYRSERLIASYPVAIGKEGWQTPRGSFKVLQMRKNPIWRHPLTGEIVRSGAKNPLGSRWIGFWSDGRSQIGFHGTNDEQLVGQAVSHGCLRMENQDVEKIYSQVAVGTPVIVRE
jgi:lipoprotein-anchoring transpeptidase ErfK/SrfK